MKELAVRIVGMKDQLPMPLATMLEQEMAENGRYGSISILSSFVH